MRLYVDSNVLISLIKNELNGGFRPLYHYSENFFCLCRERNIIVVISGLFLKEVKSKLSLTEKEILDYLESICCIKYELAFPTAKIAEENKELKAIGVHYPDSLHAAYALETNCEYLVTWNKKDFEPLENLIRVISPDEVRNHIP